MSKSNVTPNPDKVAGRERQGEDIAPTPDKQNHADNLARRRTEIGARARKPAPRNGKASPDAAPTRFAPPARIPKATRRADLRPTGATPQLNATQAAKRASVNLQGADKRGKRSTAQKRASSRHEFDPMPATKAVAGAFGKEPSRGRLPMQKR